MALPEKVHQLDERIASAVRGALQGLREEIGDRLRQNAAVLEERFEDLESTLAGSLLSAEDLQPVAEEGVRAGRRDALTALRDASAALDRARSQREILQALLEQAGRFASRAALFLTRPEGARGWGSYGFVDSEQSIVEATFDYAEETPWGRLAAGRGPVLLSAADCAELSSRLESQLPHEAALVPLVLHGRLAAALYADRVGEGAPFEVAALQTLAFVAAQSLETLPFREAGASSTLDTGEGAEGVAPLPLWQPAAAAPPAAPAAEPAGEEAAVGAAAAEEEEPAAAAAGGEEEAAGAAAEQLEDGVVAEGWGPAAGGWGEAEEGAEAEAWEPEEEPAPAPEEGWETAEETWTAPPEPAAEEVTGEGAAAEAPQAAAEEEDIFTATTEEISWRPAVTPPSFAEEEAPFPAAEEPEEEEAPAAAEEAEEAAEASTEEAAPAAAEPAAAGFGLGIEEEEEEGGIPPAAEPEPAEEVAMEAQPQVEEAFEAADAGDTTATAELGMAEAEIAEEPGVGAGFDVDVSEDETILLSRSKAAPPPPPPTETSEVPAAGAAPRPAGTVEVQPPRGFEGPGSAFAATGAAPQVTGEEGALHEEGRRLARLLVSEIRLYNEEEVEEGRRNRDVYSRLKEEIDRSRRMYDERIDERVRAARDYFSEELVRILADGDPDALGV
jgi:hypothetical protein